MGKIITNGNVYGEKNQNVVITPEYNSGILIATITVGNNEPVKIYIPNNGGNNQ